ncbi:MAG: hypothetical protein GY951_13595, partial [Psychromonas sp.]|nr:hypothetical protein [Psychromonas sp.]
KNNVRITQEQADDYNFGHSLISGLSYSTIMVLNTELEDRLRKEKRAINFKLAKSLIEEHNSKVPRDEQKPNLANAISDEDLESLVIELQNK